MKHTPLIAVAFLGAMLFACSKDKSAPVLKTASLNDTTWRMTGYTIAFGPVNGPATGTNNFFQSYSNDPTIPCLGLNAFTFTAAGKVLWTQEPRGCSMVSNFVSSDWGTWSVNNAQTQLTVNSPQAGAGRSAMPVVYAVPGAYNYTISSTTLTLSASYIYGQKQDSLKVDRAIFTRQ
ncbi:hypothetical protein [Hymenobacter glaciei]